MVVVLIAGCDSNPSAPDDGAIAFSAGGIPGPPSNIIIPRIGPPPRVPVPLPPHAGPPSFLASMVAVGTGIDFSCALRSDGVAFCWGGNSGGRLGDGTTNPSTIPVEVSTAVPFARLFVGDEIACGLDATGQAYCWGANSAGQLGAGIPQGVPSTLPTSVAAPFLFMEMSLGLRSSCGMAIVGLAYCWGGNLVGELGVGLPAGLGTTVPLPVVDGATFGLFAVNHGFVTTCGLGTGTAVFCWGRDLGTFGNGTAGAGSLTPVLAASGMPFASLEVGGLYACGLDSAGQAYCWGQRNISGELGIGSLANPVTVPTPVVGGHRFVSIDTDDTNRSFKNTCALTTAGDAWCWGINNLGQLGATSTEVCPFTGFACSSSPVPVSGGIQFSQIAVGGDHVCGLATTGAVYCWGGNAFGQLGDGTVTNRSAPTPVRLVNLP
jgi:alpha-tubulin suppressor-like RCC1 family protein